MKNQFFYTRKEAIEDTDPLEFKEYQDSFNVDMIIRSVRMNDEVLLVLLNDIHQRNIDVPNINIKTNKMNGTKKETRTYQTEIYLNGKDIERFFNLLNIEANEFGI